MNIYLYIYLSYFLIKFKLKNNKKNIFSKINLKTKIFQKNFKNINLFFKKILFFNYYLFINFYTKILKKFYFFNLFKIFFLSINFKNNFILKNRFKKLIFTKLDSIYKNKDTYIKYLNFKVSNFFFVNFLSPIFQYQNTYINLKFNGRNLFFCTANRWFAKIFSIGLLLQKIKLRYKSKNISKFIELSFAYIQYELTKNIIILINQLSARFKIFLNIFIKLLKNLNKKFQKNNVELLKITEIIISLKFKNIVNTQKKKPRKKKHIRKRLKLYYF